MNFKDKIIIFGGLVIASTLVVSSTLSLYKFTPNDISIKIDVQGDTTKYKVTFYKFNSSSNDTPIVNKSYEIEEGKTISSVISTLPSVASSLDYYTFNNTYSNSTSFNSSISTSTILNTTVTQNLNYYPNYNGYFVSNSTSGTMIPLSLSSGTTYNSSETTFNYTTYYVYSHIKGSSLYSSKLSKTIYCDAVNGATTGKYTFSYNSSNSTSNAIRRFYYQSANGDFPQGGVNPRIHMFTNNSSGSAIATTTWPGVEMTWYKDVDINNKIWYYDVDATLYKTFMITKKWGSGSNDVWTVQYGSNATQFNFRSGTNMLAYSSYYSASWYNI